MNSIYSFSYEHVVNSIRPVPMQSMAERFCQSDTGADSRVGMILMDFVHESYSLSLNDSLAGIDCVFNDGCIQNIPRRNKFLVIEFG
jgi:hypothetical protein